MSGIYQIIMYQIILYQIISSSGPFPPPHALLRTYVYCIPEATKSFGVGFWVIFRFAGEQKWYFIHIGGGGGGGIKGICRYVTTLSNSCGNGSMCTALWARQLLR